MRLYFSPFLPPNTPMYPPSFKFMPIFHCYYIHIQTYIYIYILKYSLLSLFATCMHAFGAERLSLDSQLCSSTGRTLYPTPSFPRLPVILCEGLRLHGLFCLFHMAIGVVLVEHIYKMPLHLRLRKHCSRGDGRNVRVRGSGSWL